MTYANLPPQSTNQYRTSEPMQRTVLKPVTPENPCAVCKGDHKCSRGADGLIICGRVKGRIPAFILMYEEGEWSHYRHEDDPELYRNRRIAPSRRTKNQSQSKRQVKAVVNPQSSPIDWAKKAESFASSLEPDRRNELAQVLGIPECFLTPNVLSIGWIASESNWSFPEVDSDGKTIIGIMRRFQNPEKTKKAMPGSKRGLTVPKGWEKVAGGINSDVFVPEGASDTLILHAMAIPAIGRPSKDAKTDLLADFFRQLPIQFDIYILGENDQKENGSWPGRDGAEKTANDLARKLDRTVFWTLPPEDAKDVRAWSNTKGLGPLSECDEWTDTGEELLLELKRKRVEVKTPDRAKEESTPPESLLSFQECSDIGNGRRFVQQYGDKFRFCPSLNTWFIWDGMRWAEDQRNEVQNASKMVSRLIHEEAMNCEDDFIRKMLSNHACKSCSVHAMKNMIAAASSDPEIVVIPEQFDQDHMLLNLINGTLDLRTGKLLPHDPKRLITKFTRITYDPSAQCTEWMKFLHRIMNNSEQKVDYLQRVSGYSLTGSVKLQCMWFFYGTGANGKSTFTSILQSLLGDYGMQGNPSMITKKYKDEHPTSITDLLGKRLVCMNETEQNSKLSEALMKQLTGGDRIRAHRMCKDNIEFDPTHKFIISGNYKPSVSGSDEGFWRRLKLVPFSVIIPPDERDENLLEKLRAELPGILAWALRGCLAWQKDGMKEPPEVKEATMEYRGGEDVLALWISERCQTGLQDYKYSAGDLFHDFLEWKIETGEKGGIETNRQFNHALKEKGYLDFKNNVMCFKGIALYSSSSVGDK